jgi:hypothetical protein
LNMFDKEGKFSIDLEDEIVKGSLITHDGKVVNERVLEIQNTAGEGK